ncbi:hypothetical protein RI570_20520 [Brucella pseudogrignonensis]|uniref:hypothetical protein n=1 Tax=Brucella pseudogrignonensis TaxID=419475 RepID=UPI0028B5886C|nr:hypothetical protein [Brucella pseudogrignonensis]MDT6942441.1 hypothetical protein [Brucella pseudogrignonensis]
MVPGLQSFDKRESSPKGNIVAVKAIPSRCLVPDDPELSANLDIPTQAEAKDG